MGGMLFTCGLENICAVYQNGETQYPMHGRIRTTPAEHTAVRTRWTSEGYEMELYGEMREAELFGEKTEIYPLVGQFGKIHSLSLHDSKR